jgi:hypothetical protein
VWGQGFSFLFNEESSQLWGGLMVFFVGGVVGVAFRSSNFENYQLLLQSTCNFLQPKHIQI